MINTKNKEVKRNTIIARPKTIPDSQVITE